MSIKLDPNKGKLNGNKYQSRKINKNNNYNCNKEKQMRRGGGKGVVVEEGSGMEGVGGHTGRGCP